MPAENSDMKRLRERLEAGEISPAEYSAGIRRILQAPPAGRQPRGSGALTLLCALTAILAMAGALALVVM